jgi:hypothetical protein
MMGVKETREVRTPSLWFFCPLSIPVVCTSSGLAPEKAVDRVQGLLLQGVKLEKRFLQWDVFGVQRARKIQRKVFEILSSALHWLHSVYTFSFSFQQDNWSFVHSPPGHSFDLSRLRFNGWPIQTLPQVRADLWEFSTSVRLHFFSQPRTANQGPHGVMSGPFSCPHNRVSFFFFFFWVVRFLAWQSRFAKPSLFVFFCTFFSFIGFGKDFVFFFFFLSWQRKSQREMGLAGSRQ